MECAYPHCTCSVESVGDYCAPTCRMGIGGTGEACKCGHADCTSTNGSG